MTKQPFQFSIADALLVVAILSLWLGLARLIGASPVWRGAAGTAIALAVFAGITAALYRLVGQVRRGWAIAAIIAPLLAVGVLVIFAVVAATS